MAVCTVDDFGITRFQLNQRATTLLPNLVLGSKYIDHQYNHPTIQVSPSSTANRPKKKVVALLYLNQDDQTTRDLEEQQQQQ